MIDTKTFDATDPRVGDEILVRQDLLAEIARSAPGALHQWQFVPAGTRGKLLGWRDRQGDSGVDSRAVVDVGGSKRRLVVFVRERHVVRRID